MRVRGRDAGRCGTTLAAARGGRDSRRRGRTESRPTSGWVVQRSPQCKLVMEEKFMAHHFGQKARRLASTIVGKMNEELQDRELGKSRKELFCVLNDDCLFDSFNWIWEYITLKDIRNVNVSLSNLYRFISVMLSSNITGLSFPVEIPLLQPHSRVQIPLETQTFIHQNIFAYPSAGRGTGPGRVWNCQRDQTVLLAQFERSALRMSSRVFLDPNYTTCTLDDDLFGTRSRDNQVTTISNRKVDMEGHSSDVILDAFFRLVVQLRIRRPGESQVDNVKKIDRFHNVTPWVGLFAVCNYDSRPGVYHTEHYGGDFEVWCSIYGHYTGASCQVPSIRWHVGTKAKKKRQGYFAW